MFDEPFRPAVLCDDLYRRGVLVFSEGTRVQARTVGGGDGRALIEVDTGGGSVTVTSPYDIRYTDKEN